MRAGGRARARFRAARAAHDRGARAGVVRIAGGARARRRVGGWSAWHGWARAQGWAIAHVCVEGRAARARADGRTNAVDSLRSLWIHAVAGARARARFRAAAERTGRTGGRRAHRGRRASAGGWAAGARGTGGRARMGVRAGVSRQASAARAWADGQIWPAVLDGSGIRPGCRSCCSGSIPDWAPSIPKLFRCWGGGGKHRATGEGVWFSSAARQEYCAWQGKRATLDLPGALSEDAAAAPWHRSDSDAP